MSRCLSSRGNQKSSPYTGRQEEAEVVAVVAAVTTPFAKLSRVDDVEPFEKSVCISEKCNIDYFSFKTCLALEDAKKWLPTPY